MPDIGPECCFGGVGHYSPHEFDDFDLLSHDIVCLLARLVERAYDDDDSQINPIIDEYLPDWVDRLFVPNDDTEIPGIVLIEFANCNLVIMSGTSNFQQLSLQIGMNLEGLTDYGPFSTIPLWSRASSAAIAHMSAWFFDLERPTVYVGHSYGGAALNIAALRMFIGDNTRQLKVITFGCPKPFDQRGRAIASAYQVISYCGIDDPVPSCPPDLSRLPGIAGLVGALAASVWIKNKRPGRQYTVLDDGTNREQNADIGSGTDILTIGIAVVTNGPLDPFAGHLMESYTRRLCPSSEPIPDANGYAIYIGNEDRVCDDDLRVVLNDRTIGYVFESDKSSCDPTYCRGTLFLPSSFDPARVDIMGAVGDCAEVDVSIEYQYVPELEALPAENGIYLSVFTPNGCGSLGIIRVYRVSLVAGEIVLGDELLNEIYSTPTDMTFTFTT